MKLNHPIAIVIMVIVLLFSVNQIAEAQTHVVRGGDENPVLTIGKSTLYGAGTGLLLGLALTLVVDEDTGDVLKWSFVGGTFGGFLIGVYHVATRPSASSALLQFDESGLARIAVPEPKIRLRRQAGLEMQLNLVSLKL